MSKMVIKRAVKKAIPSAVKQQYREIIDLAQSIKLDTRHLVKQSENMDTRLDVLSRLYKESDPYQPLYGISGIDGGQRSSVDRCQALLRTLGGDVKGLRVLDVGCYFGFLTFYLAERGACAEGWDNNALNIEIATRTQDINGINASFSLREFSPEAIKAIPRGKYDVVLIYSVLHWLIALYGLEYVQKCMKLLMDRVPVVILELAQKGEDASLYWDKAVPENDLDILKLVDGYSVEKVGEFPTHLSAKYRPVYVVSRDHVSVNQRKLRIKSRQSVSYRGAERWRPIASEYVVTDGGFVKISKFGDDIDEGRRYALNEINFYLQNESSHTGEPIKNVPKLVDYEVAQDQATLVVENVSGALLCDCAASLSVKQKESVALGVLDALAAFENKGLHHNDVRSWNVIVTPQKRPVLIDMELCSSVEYEDNRVAYIWLLDALWSGRRESAKRNKTDLPDKSAFADSDLFQKLRAGVADGKTFSELTKSVAAS
ncbi:hypothetical protein CR970_00990 [Candidatus Saccharibacteria bacterium]|nr:MAG: hypothetical protein CR970_00990 [Candidatus Saccharibacteria bacterium]